MDMWRKSLFRRYEERTGKQKKFLESFPLKRLVRSGEAAHKTYKTTYNFSGLV